MSMSADDAAYSALLVQLLSDSAPSRNARVHSWIEHQYDFAFSEQFPNPASPPSPSPSSSLGAHRTLSIDRPDSPLLPRPSAERASSPCPSYDAIFFPPPSKPDDNDFEEQERLRALHFIVQEMAHWNSREVSSCHAHDTPISAPPPSPASSLSHSVSSRVLRSVTSSTRISRLPSFTSTLSSDHSQPQEILPPLPVSVIVHGEYQHDLVIRQDRSFTDGYLHRRDDSLTQDAQLLGPALDDKDSVQPSPTLSNFSCAYSRETSLTTPYASSLASPSSIAFSSSSRSPENIAPPSLPVDDPAITGPVYERSFYKFSPARKTAFPHSPSLGSLAMSSPQMNVLYASSSSHSSPVKVSTAGDAPLRLRAAKSAEHPQSRWSVATTASVTPSAAEPKASVPLSSGTPLKEKKNKSLKAPAPKKRARFISLISRLSPGRPDVSAAAQAADDVEYDSANESDIEDRERNKQRKSLSKKSSLLSLRASFSISRASFSSQRLPMSFSIEEAPPLPMSPTLTSSVADSSMPSEVSLPISAPPLSKIPSRVNVINSPLPPIPQSASTITTFQSSSQHSISDDSVASASESRLSLVCPNTTVNASRISLLPAPNKRTSLASAAGIEPMVSANSSSANQVASRSKSIFRLTGTPKGLKKSPTPGTRGTAVPTRLDGSSLPSSATPRSKIPHAPTKFNPPVKLATVIATQSRPAHTLAGPGLTSTSKLPMPPSRPPPKILRPIMIPEKPTAESLPSLPASSKLPMLAPTRGVRVGTVRGFWKRQ